MTLQKKKIIMVVKEDKQDLWIVSGGLQIGGYDTISVDHGLDAVLRTWNENVDCILLDANLSDVSGYEVCYRLRHDEFTKSIPIIMVNEDDNHKTKEKSRRAGANACLKSPVNLKEVGALVESLTKATDKRLVGV